MTSLDINEIIRYLAKVARTLHNRPEDALKELRQISSYIDIQVPFRDGHTTRVNEYSLKIGKALRLPDKQKIILETAALLHDFGKIGIDESVLLKRGKLTVAEQKEIKMHVLCGYYILSGFTEFEEALLGVKNHHEHYNGSGYPEKLSKEEISLYGRIIAIADAYDVMTSDRPYRKARTKEKAIAELTRCSGTQFDPQLVDVAQQVL
jgi:HD-GYP domain-containing protein (c-di-GMP phosphodiesterase class II)